MIIFGGVNARYSFSEKVALIPFVQNVLILLICKCTIGTTTITIATGLFAMMPVPPLPVDHPKNTKKAKDFLKITQTNIIDNEKTRMKLACEIAERLVALQRKK